MRAFQVEIPEPFSLKLVFVDQAVPLILFLFIADNIILAAKVVDLQSHVTRELISVVHSQ